MKQPELARLISSISKKEASARGWRFIAGQPYWREGPLFFTLLLIGTSRPAQFAYSLRFKWYDFDTLLWRILGLAENLTAPESLRANGAFTLPGQEVIGESIPNPPLTEAWLSAKVQDVSSIAAATSSVLLTSAGTLATYMEAVEEYQTALVTRFPHAVVNVWKERLLAAQLAGDKARAGAIAAERLAAGDTGSFMIGGQNFYQLALQHIRAST